MGSDSVNNSHILIAVIVMAIAAAFAVLIFALLRRSKNAGEKKDSNTAETQRRDGQGCYSRKNGSVSEAPPLSVGFAQNAGTRPAQEDSFGISDISDTGLFDEKGLLAVLADGNGKHGDGVKASKAAVDAALDAFREETDGEKPDELLLKLLRRAAYAVSNAGTAKERTTFAAVIIKQGQLYFVSVGDSRIYLLRGGGLIQLNREHVYGRELYDLWSNGNLSRESSYGDTRRKFFTGYLGKRGELPVDRNVNPVSLYPGDKVILMSDGVFGYISETELETLLRKKPVKAAEAVRTAVLEKHDPDQDNLSIAVIGI